MAFIKQPTIIKPIEAAIKFAENKLGQEMLPARLLLWTPKAFISSMILEGLVAHKHKRVTPRMLKLIRMQVSLLIACPFCIDMNSFGYQKFNITIEEIQAMQRIKTIKEVSSFTSREKVILYYIRGLVRTPIKHNPKVISLMTQAFNESEYATIVTTIAQVDYWTRIIQGFGIQPAGFLETCDLVNLVEGHNVIK